MRIVIDLQGAQTESRFRGIGRYSIALVAAIAKNRGPHDVIIALSGFFSDAIDDIFRLFDGVLPKENITVWHALGPVRECDVSNHSRLRVAEAMREHFIESLRPDAILVASLFEGHIDDGVCTIKCFNQIPTAVVVYDFIPLLKWDAYLGTNKIYAQHYQRKVESLKRADYLLAISNSAALEARVTLGISDDVLVAIDAGCSSGFSQKVISDVERSAILSNWGISKPFIFYSGGDEPRKNIHRFIKACGMLSGSIKEQYQVVILGRIPEDRVQLLKEFSEAHGLKSDSLRFISYVSDSVLIDLYRLCHLFVFPSLHEGFGLPALEAMSCGAPVIGSNTTSLPEVVACEEALFDPNDEVAISRKIEQVLNDDDFREKLRESGLIQAKRFSWEKSAKRALSVLEGLPKVHSVTSEWEDFLANKKSDYSTLLDNVAALLPEGVSPVELINIAACIERNEKEIKRIRSRSQLKPPLAWRIEGPFDSTYSLALLNRETARALNRLGHDVALHSTEGPGDFPPSPDFLERNPDLAAFHEESTKLVQTKASVTSRILYPPRVSDMHCRLNFLHHYAWEESGFPQEWVEDFNTSLSGITYLSKHVSKLLIDHGVCVSGAVSGSGVDHWEHVFPDASYSIQAKKIRFLHVSSCFPRKGADVLLKAYGSAFTSSDEVTLVIKTHPNPHNGIHALLAEERRAKNNFPDVLIIEDDLSDSRLQALYKQCHALVAPSRAEGFGLPLAEAMLSGIPVITTGWGGQLDFCSEQTAWLIDYDFQLAQTHFGLYDSTWAEPRAGHLARIMREIYELPDSERTLKSQRGREILLSDFSWDKVVQRLVNAAHVVSKRTFESSPKIGWVTSWNTRCGIASYSAYLIEQLPESRSVKVFAPKADLKISEDAQNVTRCWEPHEEEDLNRLSEAIKRESVDVLVVQFNYGFFNLERLNQFLIDQENEGRVLVLVLHSTIDPAHFPHKKLSDLVEGMKRCHRVLVHSVADLNRLKNLGLIDNVTLFPHGILDYSPQGDQKVDSVFRIASFGFFLPQKGLLELMDAVNLLHDRGIPVSLSMLNSEFPDPVSRELIGHALGKAKRSSAKIEICTEFLSDSECLDRLSQMDLVVFPYRNTAESSSAAVRGALASGAPVAVTPVSIFDDVDAVTHKLSGFSPDAIANSISDFIRDSGEGKQYISDKSSNAQKWRDAHRYSTLSRRLYNMLTALNNQRVGDLDFEKAEQGSP